MNDRRLEHLARFYALLDRLEQNIGGARTLAEYAGRMVWPQRGVYFFLEDGEQRSDTGTGPRIVRVGTHSVSEGSKTNLWTRLSQHKGQHGTGGRNHRGSVFRLLVGASVIAQHNCGLPTWGDKNKSRAEVRTLSTPSSARSAPSFAKCRSSGSPSMTNRTRTACAASSSAMPSRS